jgi:hypothetical protein
MSKKTKLESDFSIIPIELLQEILHYTSVFEQCCIASSVCKTFKNFFSTEEYFTKILIQNNLFMPIIKKETLLKTYLSSPQSFYSFIFHPMNKINISIQNLKELAPGHVKDPESNAMQLLIDFIEKNHSKEAEEFIQDCDIPPEAQMLFVSMNSMNFDIYFKGTDIPVISYTYKDDEFPGKYLDFAVSYNTEMGYAYDVHYYVSLVESSFGKLFCNNCIYFSGIKDVKLPEFFVLLYKKVHHLVTSHKKYGILGNDEIIELKQVNKEIWKFVEEVGL